MRTTQNRRCQQAVNPVPFFVIVGSCLCLLGCENSSSNGPSGGSNSGAQTTYSPSPQPIINDPHEHYYESPATDDRYRTAEVLVRSAYTEELVPNVVLRVTNQHGQDLGEYIAVDGIWSKGYTFTTAALCLTIEVSDPIYEYADGYGVVEWDYSEGGLRSAIIYLYY